MVMNNDFNLLPSELKSRWHIQWNPKIIVLTILVCIAGLALMEVKAGRLRGDRTVVETSIRRRRDIAEMQYLAERSSSLSKNWDAVDAVVADHVIWSNLFIDLARSTPEGLRLGSITMNAFKGSFIIQGTANTSDSVLLFKQNLKSLSHFSDAAISNMARNPDSEVPEVNFEISCGLTKTVK